MSEESKPAPVVSAESEAVMLIKRLNQRLDFLEKKIDTLLAQSQTRPPFREKTFQRPPFRPSSRYIQPDRTDRDPRREKKFEAPRPEGQGHQSRSAFVPKKKLFYHKRKER
jgi:hypothetical protein